jgi:hypothetical protein
LHPDRNHSYDAKEAFQKVCPRTAEHLDAR